MDRYKKFDRIFNIFIALIAAFSFTFAIYSRLSNVRLNEYKISTGSYSINDLEKEIAALKLNIKKLSNQKVIKDNTNVIKDNTKKVEYNKENQKIFESFNLKLTELNEQVTGLRQAIDPIKPEEVLTIVRLKDTVELIILQVNKLEKELDKKHENFKSAVIRELDASTRATNWLFVVLVPVVLNLLYSIWKDRKDSKDKTPQAGQKQEDNNG